MNHIVLIATVAAKANKAEFVKTELNKLVKPIRAEVGNIAYKVHQDLQNDHKFVIIEHWTDQNAIKNHMATDHFQNYQVVTTQNDAIESFEYVTLTEI